MKVIWRPSNSTLAVSTKSGATLIPSCSQSCPPRLCLIAAVPSCLISSLNPGPAVHRPTKASLSPGNRLRELIQTRSPVFPQGPGGHKWRVPWGGSPLPGAGLRRAPGRLRSPCGPVLRGRRAGGRRVVGHPPCRRRDPRVRVYSRPCRPRRWIPPSVDPAARDSAAVLASGFHRPRRPRQPATPAAPPWDTKPMEGPPKPGL